MSFHTQIKIEQGTIRVFQNFSYIKNTIIHSI